MQFFFLNPVIDVLFNPRDKATEINSTQLYFLFGKLHV